MDLLLWIMLHSIAHGLKPYGQNSVPFSAVNCFIDRRARLISRYVEITILSKIGELQKSVFFGGVNILKWNRLTVRLSFFLSANVGFED